MASGFRGRGRGRFGGGGRGGGGGFRIAKQVPFELFPVVEELGTAASLKQDESFARRYNKLQKYWNSSPYYVGDESGSSKNTQRREIERFSERKKGKTEAKSLLSDFVRMEADYVPAELAKGERKEKRGVKRVRWNPESEDMQKLDIFEKLEHKHQGDEEVTEKKEDEEEEDDERIEEEEEEYSDDGDYNQNIDFDDDEDDFNMPDDNGDEPEF